MLNQEARAERDGVAAIVARQEPRPETATHRAVRMMRYERMRLAGAP